MTSARSSSIDFWVCLDTLPVFSQWYWGLLFSRPAVLQVTTLLNVAGVAHAVYAASAGYTKFVLILTCRSLTLDQTSWHAVAKARLLDYARHYDDDGDFSGSC